LLRESLELRLLLLDLSAYFAELLAHFERVLHRLSLLQDRQVLSFFCPQIAQVRGLVHVLPGHVLRLHSLAFHSQPQLANLRARLLETYSRHSNGQRATGGIWATADLGSNEEAAQTLR